MDILNLSFGICSSAAALREALQKVGRGSLRFGLLPLSDAEVARFLVQFGASLSLEVPVHQVLGPLFDGLAVAAQRPPPFLNRMFTTQADPQPVNPAAVAQALGDHVPAGDALFFDRVAAHLDFPEATFPVTQSLNFVVTVVTLGAAGGVFPTKHLVAPWANARAQAEALLHCVQGAASNAPSLVRLNFGYGAAVPARVLAPVDAARPLPPSLFTSLDAYAALLRLSVDRDPAAAGAAIKVLEFAAGAGPAQAPELVLLAMAHSKVESRVDADTTGQGDPVPARQRLYNHLHTMLFGPFFTTPVAQPPDRFKAALLARLWAISPTLAVISLLSLARGLAEKQARANGNDEAVALKAALEGAARAAKLLSPLAQFAHHMLGCPSPTLAVDAALALTDPEADAELRERLVVEKLPALRLDTWLAGMLGLRGPGGHAAGADKVALAAAALLKRAAGAQARALQVARAELGAPLEGPAEGAAGGAEESAAQAAAARDAVVSADAVSALLRALKGAGDSRLLSDPALAEVASARDAVRRVYAGVAEREAGLGGGEPPSVVKELFAQVLSEALPVPAFIERLRSIKDHDPALFQHFRIFCFDVHRDPRNPDLPGVLFGQFIQQQFFTDVPANLPQIGLALKVVLDKLKKAPRAGDAGSSRSFRFGMWALEQFKALLPKWPTYISHILQVPHVRVLFPSFSAELEAAKAAADGGHAARPPTAALVPGDPLRPGPGAEEWAEELERRLAAAEGGGGGGGSGGGGSGGGAGAGGASAPTAAPPAGPPRPPAPVGSPAYTGEHANELRSRFAGLGADLAVALSALAEGRSIPTILPSAVAAAAAAKEAEESAAAVASNGSDAGAVERGTLEEPPAAVSDRIQFLLNNLEPDNEQRLVDTAREITALLKPEYGGWFASYLTLKRALGQANYQPQLVELLERLASKELTAMVLKAAVDASKKLLAKPIIRSSASSTDRKQLKDLGQWIGRLTLARNKPLLHRDLFLRELLHEAYETGRLVAVVAFVAKILESCKDSTVFRPPNPWTLSVLSAMRELHELPPLKLNLKFEVEVLATALNVELKNLAPSAALQKRRKPNLHDTQWPNQDFTNNTQLQMLPGVTTRDTMGGGGGGSVGGVVQIPGLLGLVTLRTMGPIFHRGHDMDYAAISAAVNRGDGEDPGAEADEAGGAKATFRNVVAVALDTNLRELIEPVVQRSTKIAGKTTLALILKDFAMDTDAVKMMRAAHTLATDLAGSLAVSTVLEPLQARTQTKLHELIKANPSVLTSLPVDLTKLDDGCVMKLIGGVVSENMQLGSLLVEKATMDQMQREITEQLADAAAQRRRAAEARTPLHGPAAGRYPNALPEELRPRPSGLTPQQMRTFETSFRSGGAGAEEALNAAPPAHEPLPQGESVPADQMLTPPQGLEEFHKLINDSLVHARVAARQLRARNPANPFFPQDNELVASVRARVRKIGAQLQPGDHREQCVMRQVAPLFKFLFTPPDCTEPAMQQFFCMFLQCLSELSPSGNVRDTLMKYMHLVAPETIFAPGMGDAVFLGLLRHKLFNAPDVDQFLQKCAAQGAVLNDPGAPSTQFFLRVLERALVVDKVLAHEALPLAHEQLVGLARRFPRGTPKAPGNLAPIAVLQACKEAAAAPPLSLAPLPPGTPILTVNSMHTAPSQAGLERALEASEAVRRTHVYTDAERQQALWLLETWVRVNGEPDGDAKVRNTRQFLSILQQRGVLSSEDQLDQFFRVLMDLCKQSCSVTATDYAPDESRGVGALATPNPTLFGAAAAPVPTPQKKLTYMGVDALAKLIHVLLKNQGNKKAMIAYLNQIMTFITKALLKDADVNCGGSTEALAAGGVLFSAAPQFDGRPYLRLLTQLFPLTRFIPPLNLEPTDPAVLEVQNFNATVLATFANVLHHVNPTRVPGFAFPWLELVSHRALTPELLSVSGQRGWSLVHRLLLHMLRFLYPYLRRGELNDGLRLFYKGALRLLVVLVHDDVPEFIADYAWSLCEAIPLQCLQLRNLVLSATPVPLRGRESDWDRPEKAPACALLPRMLTPAAVAGAPAPIMPETLRREVNEFLGARPPIRGALQPLPAPAAANPLAPASVPPLPPAAAAAAAAIVPLLLADGEEQALVLSRYSLRAINGLCLHLVSETLKYLLQEAGGGGAESRSLRVMPAATLAAAVGTGASELFRALLAELDAEGRYALLATAATHLRYPNAHTLFFHRLFLSTWASSDTDATREILARVLAERLLAHGPHPWGLRATFAELVRPREGAEGGVLFSCAFAKPAAPGQPPNPASALFTRLAQTAREDGPR